MMIGLKLRDLVPPVSEGPPTSRTTVLMPPEQPFPLGLTKGAHSRIARLHQSVLYIRQGAIPAHALFTRLTTRFLKFIVRPGCASIDRIEVLRLAASLKKGVKRSRTAMVGVIVGEKNFCAILASSSD